MLWCYIKLRPDCNIWCLSASSSLVLPCDGGKSVIALWCVWHSFFLQQELGHWAIFLFPDKLWGNRKFWRNIYLLIFILQTFLQWAFTRLLFFIIMDACDINIAITTVIISVDYLVKLLPIKMVRHETMVLWSMIQDWGSSFLLVSLLEEKNVIL